MTPGRTAPRRGLASIMLLAGVLPLAVPLAPTDASSATRLLVLAAGLALGALAPAGGRLDGRVRTAILVGLGVFLASAAISATPALSLLGRFPRYEGLLTVAAYGTLLALGARLLSARDHNNREAFLSALAVAAGVNALVAASQLIGAPTHRVTGLLGNSSILGAFGVVALAALGSRLLVGMRSWGLIAGTLAGGMCLALSASRGALVGLAVAAVVGAAALALRKTGRSRWWWPLLGAAALGAAMLLLPSGRARLTGATPFAEATVSGRLLLWQETWRLWLDQPWLGVGPSGFVDAIGRYHTAAWAEQVGPYAPPDSPHLVLLQVLASTGVLGLLAIAVLAGTLLLALLPALRVTPVTAPDASRRAPGRVPPPPIPDGWVPGALAAAAGLGATYLTSFTDPVCVALVALLLGGAVAVPAQGQDRVRWLVLPVALALAWLAAGVLVAEQRFSSALAGPDPGPALASLAAQPGWDPDLPRRIGYALNRLAERGEADPGLAVPVLAGACPRLPSSVECLHSLADAQDLAGDPAAALTTLDRAAPLDPTNVDTALKRGIALAELSRYPEAEEAFRRAAALRPSAAEPWTNLARLFRLTGRPTEADEAQRRADELTPR